MRMRLGVALTLVVGVAIPVVLAGSPPVAAVGKLSPGERRCFEVAGSPGDVALVNLTPVQAEGRGYGLLVSSDVVDVPVASNVNFDVGTTDPNVAAAAIGADGQVCYLNSEASTHLVADHLGTIDAGVYTAAQANGAPLRKLDTRGGAPLAPGARQCFSVAGSPGDVALVNLTPVQAQGRGYGLLVSSDMAGVPVASSVNFAVGTTDPNVAAAAIGADGQVCYLNSEASTHLIADHLGTVDGDAYTAAQANGAPLRKLDTRGGALLAPGARQCFSVAGSPGDVALVNLTPVQAQARGYGLLVSSDVTGVPVASNVNFNIGTTDPNVAAAAIGADGRVCYLNSEASSHLIADHLGTVDAAVYTAAQANGAPLRKLDTRQVSPPSTTTTTTTTTLPPLDSFATASQFDYGICYSNLTYSAEAPAPYTSVEITLTLYSSQSPWPGWTVGDSVSAVPWEQVDTGSNVLTTWVTGSYPVPLDDLYTRAGWPENEFNSFRFDAVFSGPGVADVATTSWSLGYNVGGIC